MTLGDANRSLALEHLRYPMRWCELGLLNDALIEEQLSSNEPIEHLRLASLRRVMEQVRKGAVVASDLAKLLSDDPDAQMAGSVLRTFLMEPGLEGVIVDELLRHSLIASDSKFVARATLLRRLQGRTVSEAEALEMTLVRDAVLHERLLASEFSASAEVVRSLAVSGANSSVRSRAKEFLLRRSK